MDQPWTCENFNMQSLWYLLKHGFLPYGIHYDNLLKFFEILRIGIKLQIDSQN
jgi:hypothetical protein